MRGVQPLRQAAATSSLPLRLRPLHAELLGTLMTLARCSGPGWLSEVISPTDAYSSYVFYQHEIRILDELRNVLGPHELVGAGGGDGVTVELYDRAELETPNFVTKHLISVLRVMPEDQVPPQVLDQLCMDLQDVCTRHELVHELQRNETKAALSSLKAPSTNSHGSATDPALTAAVSDGRLEGAVTTIPAVAPPAQVFVSHVAHESGGGGDGFARKLGARLEDAGYSVFMSDSVGGGHSWGRIMDTAIRNCVVFIPIISPSYGDALTSKWVGADILCLVSTRLRSLHPYSELQRLHQPLTCRHTASFIVPTTSGSMLFRCCTRGRTRGTWAWRLTPPSTSTWPTWRISDLRQSCSCDSLEWLASSRRQAPPPRARLQEEATSPIMAPYPWTLCTRLTRSMLPLMPST